MEDKWFCSRLSLEIQRVQPACPTHRSQGKCLPLRLFSIILEAGLAEGYRVHTAEWKKVVQQASSGLILCCFQNLLPLWFAVKSKSNYQPVVGQHRSFCHSKVWKQLKDFNLPPFPNSIILPFPLRLHWFPPHNFYMIKRAPFLDTPCLEKHILKGLVWQTFGKWRFRSYFFFQEWNKIKIILTSSTMKAIFKNTYIHCKPNANYMLINTIWTT